MGEAVKTKNTRGRRGPAKRVVIEQDLDFSYSWKIQGLSSSGSIYVFSYNHTTKMVETHTEDEDGKRLLTLVPLPIDRFTLLINKLCLVKKEYL